MDDLTSLDTLLEGMDKPTTEPVAATPEPEAAPPPEPEAPETEPTTPEPEAAATAQGDDLEVLFEGRRQNQAFAQMRIQNKEQLGVLKRLAGIMQVPTSLSPADLVAEVAARLDAVEAQVNSMPPETVAYNRELEERATTAEQQVFRNAATLGFQKVKDEYGLSQGKLQEFAARLHEEGLNPFAAKVDIVAEYRRLYFDDILKAERKKAIAEEQARLAEVSASATTPTAKVGTPKGQAKDVDTVSGLNELLAGLK